ncbi:MAG: prephenate dehydratase [Bacteroidales bacterium]|nr:prephenate dehydratase [Bacteroidales bacterium]
MTLVKRIAIQGGYGAFHEIAAMHYFENEKIEVVPGITFKDLFQNLKSRNADYGIMAIENMVAGSIIPNYKLLKESNMKIIGEIYLRIKQNLIALPGQTINDIKEVYSHPMAILQCQDFFEQYPHIKSIDSADTALSAKDIKENKLKGIGAIASDQAAKMYDLEILLESIESNKMNYTRFLILKDKNGGNACDDKANKASISFAVSHKIGSLSKVLSIFSFFNINLCKIQSFPIIGKEWEYLFYADLEIDDYETYKQALESAKPFMSQFKILGEYKKGKSIM